MAVKGGGGAAVASGADFQSRVAAYILTASICEYPIDFFDDRAVVSLSFETAEPIDDLNVMLSDAQSAYIQAKASLDYSLADGSQLNSVWRQFVNQYHRLPYADCRYLLVTGAESSRKVIGDLKLALDAYRSGRGISFERDQPKAILTIIRDLRQFLIAMLTQLGDDEPQTHAVTILHRSHVVPLDLGKDALFERNVPLLLWVKGFTAPRLVWGKLISDCLDHARHRRTIHTPDVLNSYQRFLLPAQVAQSNELLKVVSESGEFSVGKEVVLGIVEQDRSRNFAVGALVMAEMRRFDEDCQQAIRFRNDRCFIAGGRLVLKLLDRSATSAGMIRLIEARSEEIEGRALYHIPMSPEEDLEESLCAEQQKALLKSAWKANSEPLRCLHCGKIVSMGSGNTVEARIAGQLRVGLVHPSCKRPENRVIGLIKNEFFEQRPFLRNFDLKRWVTEIPGGQAAFGSQRIFTSSVVVWNGTPSTPPGDWVIEYSLGSDESEFILRRGKVHRFSKSEAEAFCEKLASQWKQAKEEGDPYCESAKTRAYGRRSVLLRHLKVAEELQEIRVPKVTKFEEQIAERYQDCRNWYAPLIFLRRISDGVIFDIGGYIPMLTNPLDFQVHLKNWEQAMPIPDYEVMILADDREFDDFARTAQSEGMGLIVDPVVDPSGRPDFLAGTPIKYIDELLALSPDLPK